MSQRRTFECSGVERGLHRVGGGRVVSMPPLPVKLAIVGGGPSAFYVASRLLSRVPHADPSLRVHIFDRLWAPHGLVRYGVAPDHPEVKVRARPPPPRPPLTTDKELHQQVRPHRR